VIQNQNGSPPFFYRGEISASKSLLNRALIIQSFFSSLQLTGDSNCDDVIHMKKAIESLRKKETDIYCGEAGTTFRFMAIRASREKAETKILGEKRLMERPHQDVIGLLTQLGVRASLDENGLNIRSEGWKKPKGKINISREKTSQFATGFLINCWELPFDLEFELSPKNMADSYWDMSLKMVKDLGMEIQEKNTDEFFIPAAQKLRKNNYQVEPDMSSAFTLAALAALYGDLHLQGVAHESLQPDSKFFEILMKMKIYCKLDNEKNELTVSCTDRISSVKVDLRETPDLFPVLCVLCAFAEGKSELYGAPRLAHKESHRIKKSAELLSLMGIKNEAKNDGIIIHGQGRLIQPRNFDFNPDHDHRMAMAAGILLRMGWLIKIFTPGVVSKSFPDFWEVIGVTP
jgi:3-phosphoshikimate 1-carboxyvinyltransferase